MTAKIIMVVDGEEYEYGTYPFDTNDQKNKVNSIAERIRIERNCESYVKRMDEE